MTGSTMARSRRVVPLTVPDSPDSARNHLRAVGQPFDLSSAYDDHAASLFGFAVNALRDRGLAEDCVQETFLRAWRARDRFDPSRGGTRTWLFAIARNVITDVRRSLQRMPHLVGGEVLDEVAAAPDGTLDRLTVIEALAKLSPEHRDTVVAIHLTGTSYSELSDRTGVPVATLRTRAYYALRALRAHLDEKGDQHD